MKIERMRMLAALWLLGACGVVHASEIEPFIHFKMDAIENGKVLNVGTNTSADCNLTLGPAVCTTNINGIAGVYFPPTTNSWAYAWSPAVASRTVSFWICREPNDDGFDEDEVGDLLEKQRAQYLITGWNVSNYMLAPNNTSMTVKFGRYEKTAEEIAKSYFYYCSEFARGDWHHIAITLDYEGEDTSENGGPIYSLRSYVDGLLYKDVLSRTCESNLVQASSFWLCNIAMGGGRPLNCTLSDFKMYDCALTASDVFNQFKTGLDNFSHNLLARYTFDNVSVRASDSKRVAPDVMGNSGDMEFGDETGVQVDIPGVDGKGVYFMGHATQTIGTATIRMKGPELYDYTVSMWLKVPRDVEAICAEACRYMGRFWVFGHTRFMMNHTPEYSEKTVHGDFFLPGDRECTAPYLYAEKGSWAHVAVCMQMRMDVLTDAPTYCNYSNETRATIYVNGERVFSNDWARVVSATNKANRLSRPDTNINMGNASYAGCRALAFTADDLRVYRGVLTEEEVKAVYGGVAIPDAGGDFTTASQTATLQGVLNTWNDTIYGRPRTVGELKWELISAPAGGEGAIIETPQSEVTQVSLPVEGAYVFRLSCSAVGVTESDEITVTRGAAAAANAKPTVSIADAGVTMPGASLSLVATVADEDNQPGTLRGHWRKMSGPGGVWFSDVTAASTTADFSAAGTYVLRYVVSDGQDEASADVTVVVAGADVDAHTSLTNGLIGYWPIRPVNVANEGAIYDVITGQKAVRNFNESSLAKGVDGWGYRGYGKTSTFETVCSMREDGTDGCRPIPKEGEDTVWRSFSFWMYHDTNTPNTNETKNVLLAGVEYASEFIYKPEDGVDGNKYLFYLWGQSGYDTDGSTGPAGGGGNMYFGCPALSPTNRWMHVYVAFDRYRPYPNNDNGGNGTQLWLDGVRQKSTSGYYGYSRKKTNEVCFGGLRPGAESDKYHSFNGYFTNGVGETISRTFSGWMDEMRMYDRLLSTNEIQYLASRRGVTLNRGPSVGALSTTDLSKSEVTDAGRTVYTKPLTFSPTVNGDTVPYDQTLTYTWECIGGDGSKVVFSAANARETQVTLKAAGSYVIRLIVSDGERTTYSDPFAIDAIAPGTVIYIR